MTNAIAINTIDILFKLLLTVFMLLPNQIRLPSLVPLVCPPLAQRLLVRIRDRNIMRSNTDTINPSLRIIVSFTHKVAMYTKCHGEKNKDY